MVTVTIRPPAGDTNNLTSVLVTDTTRSKSDSTTQTTYSKWLISNDKRTMVENAVNKRKSKHRSVFWCSFPQTVIAVRLDRFQCAFRLIGGHFTREGSPNIHLKPSAPGLGREQRFTGSADAVCMRQNTSMRAQVQNPHSSRTRRAAIAHYCNSTRCRAEELKCIVRSRAAQGGANEANTLL